MSGVPPIILTIQVCDSVVLDQRTGRASVLNIFETINAPEYPATHHSMTFFSELTNGHGKVDINVKLVDVQEDDKTIAEVNDKLKMPPPARSARKTIPAFKKAATVSRIWTSTSRPIPVRSDLDKLMGKLKATAPPTTSHTSYAAPA